MIQPQKKINPKEIGEDSFGLKTTKRVKEHQHLSSAPNKHL